MLTLRILVVTLVLIFSSQVRAAIIYTVNLDGIAIDLTGFIEVNSTGAFSPTQTLLITPSLLQTMGRPRLLSLLPTALGEKALSEQT